MRIGISLNPAVVPEGGPEQVLRLARETERLGFDCVQMSGQVLYDTTAHGSQLDPLMLLSAVAGATERLGLITSVLALPNYNPVVLANQAATLDVLSGGRFTLGVGVGWNPEEFSAVGVPFEQRGRRTDEHLEVMRALWSKRPASFDGRFTSFRDATLGTRPVTDGGPPIWVGGHSDAALRRALRFAQAWHGISVSPEGVTELRRRLVPLADDVGRDAATLELNSVYFLIPPGLTHNGFMVGRPLGGTHPSGESVADELGRRQEAGISMCDLILAVKPGEMLDAVGWVAAEVLPKLDGRSAGPAA